MATILNSCKETRKIIREIEKQIEESVLVWKRLKDDSKVPAAVFIDKSENIKPGIQNLMGRLEMIDKELEKDSQERRYYNCVYNKCKDFLGALSAIESNLS